MTPLLLVKKFLAATEYERKEHKKHEMITEMTEHFSKTRNVDQRFVHVQIHKFASYWKEPCLKGKKVRWQYEKFFSLNRRFATWIGFAIEREKPMERKKPNPTYTSTITDEEATHNRQFMAKMKESLHF